MAYRVSLTGGSTIGQQLKHVLWKVGLSSQHDATAIQMLCTRQFRGVMHSISHHEDGSAQRAQFIQQSHTDPNWIVDGGRQEMGLVFAGSVQDSVQ